MKVTAKKFSNWSLGDADYEVLQGPIKKIVHSHLAIFANDIASNTDLWVDGKGVIEIRVFNDDALFAKIKINPNKFVRDMAMVCGYKGISTAVESLVKAMKAVDPEGYPE